MKNTVSKILTSLKKTRSKFWNISPEFGQFLNILIRDRKYHTVLEIGTSNGYSGIWMAEALSHTNGHLYTIESHKKDRFSLAEENFKSAGLSKNITQILGHAPEAIPSTPRKFDLVFLDATKYEYPLYLDAVKARLKKGGLIIADNIDSHKKELAPFIKKLKKEFRPTKLNIGSGVLVLTLL